MSEERGPIRRYLDRREELIQTDAQEQEPASTLDPAAATTVAATRPPWEGTRQFVDWLNFGILIFAVLSLIGSLVVGLSAPECVELSFSESDCSDRNQQIMWAVSGAVGSIITVAILLAATSGLATLARIEREVSRRDE